MIVSCENCHTRFKIDEKRLRPAGVKLRCSKCQHTFELKPLAPAGAAPAPSPPTGEHQEFPAERGPIELPTKDAPPTTEVRSAPDDSAAVPKIASGAAAEVIPEVAPDSAAGGPLHPDQIDLAVEEALRMPEGPTTGDLNQAEGGERSGSAKDLFGAPDAVDLDVPPPEPFADLAPNPSDLRERSDEFDWDHVSFTETYDNSVKESQEPNRSVASEPLELDVARPAMQPGRGAAPRNLRTSIPKKSDSDSTGLELARPVSIASAVPSPPESAPRAFSPEDESARPKRPEAPVHVATPGAVLSRVVLPLPSPATARMKRSPLGLPTVPTLVGSILLGLLVALVSAFTLYAPDGLFSRSPSTVRPQGAGQASAALRIEDLAGRPIRRDDAAPLYVVTGKAIWSATPKGVWFLDGVLVDRSGHALQRRSAQVGRLSALFHLLATDPARLDGHTPLSEKGASGFLILFTPEPSWQADVRFEVRKAD